MSELDVSDLLTVDQAIAIVDAVPVTPRVIRVALEQAQGLRLAQDIVADRDYPPFNKSLMDGFAVTASERAGARLRLSGEIAAGGSLDRALKPGEAAAIMTGAPLPPGAVAVVPVEETQVIDDAVIIHKAGDAARHVAAQGSDVSAGQVVMRKATRLEAAQLAAAAMVGAAQVETFSTPTVGVLATGDEIVPFHQRPESTQIRNSNSIMLLAMLRRIGCRAIDLGHVRDEPERIREALVKGMQLDVLIVTGGMSMGKYDHVPKLLKELGVDLKITRLRIKPGKPFGFGTADRKELWERLRRRGLGAALPLAALGEGQSFVFGLPGNPVSGFACTARLVSRLLTRLSGGEPRERWVVGRTNMPLGPNGPREFYQPAIIDYRADGPRITPLVWKGSADLFTLTQANALLVRAENEPALATDSVVRAMEI